MTGVLRATRCATWGVLWKPVSSAQIVMKQNSIFHMPRRIFSDKGKSGLMVFSVLMLGLCLPNPLQAQSEKPADVIEIEAEDPLEISGVAALPGGFAVVGDSNNKYGRIWPGGVRFNIPEKTKDLEGIDIGFKPNGEALWLFLGEDNRTITDLSGGRYKLPKTYKEICGRGLEGIAVRWHENRWQVAVAWEGGEYKRGCKKFPGGQALKPRVAILSWKKGQGLVKLEKEFSLDTPASPDGNFRAADMVWHGDNLLVLLRSINVRKKKYKHTWLQAFTLEGKHTGVPVKLRERWGAYAKRKNFEALDWSLDGKKLVLGYDADSGKRVLIIFPYPGNVSGVKSSQ